MAEPIARITDEIAAGNRLLEELAQIYAGAGRQRDADLAAWRRSVGWDRQAPAPRHAPIEQP